MPDSSTVADAATTRQRLQVRVDVRLDDVPQVQSARGCEIETPLGRQAARRRGALATSQADIQKNTLQVKVTHRRPAGDAAAGHACQVTFLCRRGADDRPAKWTSRLRLLVPRSWSTGETAAVWVADRDRRRRASTACPTRRRPGELVEVAGLTPSDKLIVGGREGLEDGDRIRVTGEDKLRIRHRTTEKVSRRHGAGRSPRRDQDLPQGRARDHAAERRPT